MHTIKIIFSLLATTFYVIAFFLYIRDMFRRTTEPHLYTWIIWLITQGTATYGVWIGGAGITGSLGFIVSMFFLLLVVLLSLKYGTKNITLGDTIMFFAALIAVLTWWQLHNPILAIFMVSAIDFLGYIPSYRKSWTEPWSETVFSWILFFTGNILTMIALEKYNFLTLTYLITIAVCNIVFIVLCLVRRRKIPKPIAILK